MIAVLSAVTPSLTPALPRYPIDFPPYDIVLLRGATEPFFVAANVSTCTLNREKGYSLNAPGFTHGDPGHNAVSVNASFINASAIACHVVDSIITAGNTTVVLDAGGTACETALGALCPASKAARGAACWNCTHVPATKALLKAAGCAKGDFKAYCGPQSVANAAPYDVVAGELQRAETLGSKVCASGPYACAYIEHFAAIAPAFGRRPYFGETEGAVVVKSDYSFEGETLTLRVRISGTDIFGRNGTQFAGGRSVRLPFDLTVLPPLVSERVDITVTRADGRVAAKPKRFLRAPPPEGPTQPGITIQVDHESIGGGGMLIGGVPHVSNGWFGAGLDFMSAGLPQPDACAAPRTNGNTNAVNSAGSASIVSEMGKRGLTFVRAGTAGITLWHASIMLPENKALYEEQWRFHAQYLNAAHAAGVYVLVDIGADPLASCLSGWEKGHEGALAPGDDGCWINGTKHPENIAKVEAWVYDNVKRFSAFPAVAGYYSCDDCCHVVRGKFAGAEYTAIASIHDHIFTKLDPYRLMFGTIACGETWLWQEEGFGLGMDVAMKEGYGGGVGGAKYTPRGMTGALNDYPMTHEPIWGMGDPGAKASQRVLRSSAYAHLISTGNADNSFYPLNRKVSDDVQMMAACERTGRELSELSSAVRSRVHLDPATPFVQPIVRPIGGAIDPAKGVGSKPIVAAGRVWPEPTPLSLNASAAAQYYCYTAIVLHGASFPALLSAAIDGLHLPPAARAKLTLAAASGSAARVLPLTRLFRGTDPEVLNATLLPNGTALFADVFDLQSVNVYRIGCDIALLKAPLAATELCVADCDFEESALEGWRPLMLSAKWDAAAGLGGEHVMIFNTTDDRVWLRTDTSVAHQGRYSAKLNVPSSIPVLVKLPIPSLAFKTNGVARVRFAARASLPGTQIGALFYNFSLAGYNVMVTPNTSNIATLRGTTEWALLDFDVEVKACTTKFRFPPMQIWVKPPMGAVSGVKVWLDAISVVMRAQ